MGWKYEVEAYQKVDGEYRYVPVYQGNSRAQMLKAVRKARKTSGAVQVTLR